MEALGILEWDNILNTQQDACYALKIVGAKYLVEGGRDSLPTQNILDEYAE